ncbi:MAG: formylmethanofuran dehydrogenase subunit E family protein [Candidatus Bathyarchaeia archaeon]
MVIACNMSSALMALLDEAEKFHGHLGPFLVIGVRMGSIGLNRLNIKEGEPLAVNALLPLHVPFSCIIDGLQVSTKCTVGNQKLSIKNSRRIQAEFERKNNGRKVSVALNLLMFERLKTQLLQEALPDKEVRKLAWKIAAVSEEELFIVT